jgi:DNA-binding transcriptional LysR family regulator
VHREDISDLLAFVTIAKAGSFTKAAAKLGVSQSAISHAVRQFEARLGLPLLMRTTRSVSPTDAGERLLHSVGKHFDEIKADLLALKEQRERPSGNIRLTATGNAVEMALLPRLAPFLQQYPDIKVEIVIDYGLTDIVAERFDAGVRGRAQVAKDMVAVRIAPDMRVAIVGAPSYFDRYPVPEHPRELSRHNCICLRLPGQRGLHTWEFEHEGRQMRVHVTGQIVINATHQILCAALAGVGLAYVPETMVQAHIANGRLRRVLGEWCESYSGYHLFFVRRREPSQAFTLLVEALRYRDSLAPPTVDSGPCLPIERT